LLAFLSLTLARLGLRFCTLDLGHNLTIALDELLVPIRAKYTTQRHREAARLHYLCSQRRLRRWPGKLVTVVTLKPEFRKPHVAHQRQQPIGPETRNTTRRLPAANGYEHPTAGDH
jgi:hypothetical protein